MSALSRLDVLRAASEPGRYTPNELKALIARLSTAEIHHAWESDLLTVDQAASALAGAVQ